VVKGPGSTGADRWRVSFIARQAVTGWFAEDPSKPWSEQPAPAGLVLPSILVVFGQHCRLGV
jgi:hypothetical protein